MSLIRNFKQYNTTYNLFQQTDKVLFAVSGGVDSMTMLHIMHRLGVDGAVAHCNFTLRGEESDGDEEFVRRHAERMGYSFFCVRFDTKEYSQQTGKSIEMAARDLRYEWFDKLCSEHGFSRVALAHNLNDRIETFFINLTRGTGIAGLCGIQNKNGHFIRPLLFANRKEILGYAHKHAISYREDSTNKTDDYTRNYLRHNVIPPFVDYFPSFERTMSDNMDRFVDINKWYKTTIEKVLDRIVSYSGESQYMDIDDLKETYSPSLILFEWLRVFGFPKNVANNILSSLDGHSGKWFYSETHRLLCDRKTLILDPITEQNYSQYYLEHNTFSMTTPMPIIVEQLDNNESFEVDKSLDTACLDMDKLHFPLLIRHWRIGDYFCPLGMKQHKKLSDFFVDRKLSIIDKEKVWLLCSEDKIVWVMGHRIDDRFKITSKTKHIYRISIG